MTQSEKNIDAGWKKYTASEDGKRNNEINILKLAAVLLVVLIHDRLPGRTGTVVRGAAAAAVPVFFMISGYFSYGSGCKTIRKRASRMFSLLVFANAIYFFWDIGVEVLSGNSVGVWLKEVCSAKRILVFLLLNESSLRGHLWFLGALLYAYLCLFFMMHVRKGKLPEETGNNRGSRLLIMLSGFLLLINLIGGELLTQCGKDLQIPYIRNWLFAGLPFFGIGYWIHSKETWIRQTAGSQKTVTCLVIFLALNIAEVSLVRPCELYLTTIPVSVTAFLSALLYQGKAQSRLLLWGGQIADRYGLWIYILQIIVIKNIRWFYDAYGMGESVALQWLRPLLSFTVSLLISAGWVWMLKKIKRLFRL